MALAVTYSEFVNKIIVFSESRTLRLPSVGINTPSSFKKGWMWLFQVLQNSSTPNPRKSIVSLLLCSTNASVRNALGFWEPFSARNCNEHSNKYQANMYVQYVCI